MQEILKYPTLEAPKDSIAPASSWPELNSVPNSQALGGLSGTAFGFGLSRSQGPLENARLTRVLAYIQDHISEAMTVPDLAKVACLSVFHFNRAFAAAMNVPPLRYVRRRQIESAKELIATGQTSLSEIAFDCRFSSQSSFTRAFKRATGITPAEYRRRIRIEPTGLLDRAPHPCLVADD
jgi:AraC-like DNA-binding protein